MNGTRRLYGTWLVLLGIAVIAGLLTTFKIFIEGHGLFNANDVLLWTLPLGAYIFLALASSGLALLSGVPLVFGVKEYESVAKRLVFLSIATLVGAFVCIGLELGSVFHMVYIFLSPNLSSPIWWMGAIYSLELVLLVLKFWKMHVGDWESGISKTLGVAAFICALVAPLMIGSVFGLTESRVTYFGPVMSIYALLMALLSGAALFMLYSMVYYRIIGRGVPEAHASLFDRFARVFTYILGIVVIFTFLKIIMESATTIPEFLVYHRFEHAFGAWRIFHTEVLLGLFLPFVLVLIPTVRASLGGRIVTSALVFAGVLAMHMEILLAGQSRPVGPKAEQFPAFVSYFPSVWEWLVFIFGLAIMLLLYTLGERYLKLEAATE
jgi:molybdopterin-containing oxidoreductase family membrane subunit